MNRYISIVQTALCLILLCGSAFADPFVPDGMNCSKFFELDALIDPSKKFSNFYVAPRRIEFISNPKSRSFDMTMHFGYDFSRPNTLIMIGHITSVEGRDICVNANAGLGLFVTKDIHGGSYLIPGIQVANCTNPNEAGQRPYAKVIYALKLNSDLYLRMVNEPTEALLVRVAGEGASIIPMDRPNRERFELQNMLRCAFTAIAQNVRLHNRAGLVSHKATVQEITE